MKRTTNVMDCGCPLGSLHVPVVKPDVECLDYNRVDDGALPCWRPAGHIGRHLAYWSHCGRVRSVWHPRPGAKVTRCWVCQAPMPQMDLEDDEDAMAECPPCNAAVCEAYRAGSVSR